MVAQDQVQLIAYADRLGGDLRGLADFLRRDEASGGASLARNLAGGAEATVDLGTFASHDLGDVGAP